MEIPEFEKLVGEALDTLPPEFIPKLENVVITIEDVPTPEQSQKLKLRPWTRLLGLYEGVSLRGRVNTFFSPLPDRITIFRYPILAISQTPEDVKENVRNTVIHEIAHHVGMSEAEVRKSESKRKS